MVDIVLDPLRWKAVDSGHDAVIESWLVEEGDKVMRGQVVAKVSLIDESLDVQSPDGGVVEQIAVSAGESFGPGYILARLA